MSATLNEHPITLRELFDEGLHPPMWGRFSGGELVFAIAVMPDGRARTWTREANEPCDVFAGRVTRDIVESVRGRCVGVGMVA